MCVAGGEGTVYPTCLSAAGARQLPVLRVFHARLSHTRSSASATPHEPYMVMYNTSFELSDAMYVPFACSCVCMLTTSNTTSNTNACTEH